MTEIQQIPLLPKPPRTWITLIIGAVLVLSGGIIGAGGTVLLVQNRLEQPEQQPNHFNQRLAERMTRDLGLTKEQRSDIHTIFERHQSELHTLRTSVNEQVAESFETMQTEVEAILTPEQGTQWTARIQRFNSRGERRRGEGPRHDGPPPRHDGPPPRHDGPPPPGGFDQRMDQGGRFDGPPPPRSGRNPFGPPPGGGRRGQYGPPPEGGFRNDQRPPQRDRRFEEGRRPPQGGFSDEGRRRQGVSFETRKDFRLRLPQAHPTDPAASNRHAPSTIQVVSSGNFSEFISW